MISGRYPIGSGCSRVRFAAVLRIGFAALLVPLAGEHIELPKELIGRGKSLIRGIDIRNVPGDTSILGLTALMSEWLFTCVGGITELVCVDT